MAGGADILSQSRGMTPARPLLLASAGASGVGGGEGSARPKRPTVGVGSSSAVGCGGRGGGWARPERPDAAGVREPAARPGLGGGEAAPKGGLSGASEGVGGCVGSARVAASCPGDGGGAVRAASEVSSGAAAASLLGAAASTLVGAAAESAREALPESGDAASMAGSVSPVSARMPERAAEASGSLVQAGTAGSMQGACHALQCCSFYHVQTSDEAQEL